MRMRESYIGESCFGIFETVFDVRLKVAPTCLEHYASPPCKEPHPFSLSAGLQGVRSGHLQKSNWVGMRCGSEAIFS